MPIARHTFAKLDADTDYARKTPDSFDAALNVALEPGYVLPVSGNVAVPYELPIGTNKRLGGFVDGASGTAVTLLCNSEGRHRLVRYDPAGNGGAGSDTTILEWAGLNLAPDLVPQGGIIDGLLTYLGADGLYRCVNLARAESGYYTPALLAAEPYCLHLVKLPPRREPGAAREIGTVEQDSRNALRIIQSKAYQFATRYTYADGEQTVFSPYSNWVDVTTDPSQASPYTRIAVWFEQAPDTVASIDVLVREPDSEGWNVADTLTRKNGVLPTSYLFYGPISGVGVAPTDASRLYESEWPGRVGAVAHSRALKADLLEGYPTPQPAFTAVCEETSIGSSVDFYTFHENSSYRVAIQFYDAQGKAAGVSSAVPVQIPARAAGDTNYRRVRVRLTTTDVAALQAEIPEWAHTYQWVVARNDRTTYFLQGMAADCFGYLGHVTNVASDGTKTESEKLVDIIHEPHEKVWVDIGTFPPVGMGYVWRPGDVLRFLNEGKEFLITGQYGDYVEVQWNGYPDQSIDSTGQTLARIELYTPNTTPAPLFYERGPCLPIVRDSAGQRSYSLPELTLQGDCFLTTLVFPKLDKGLGQNNDDNYQPPNVKSWLPGTAGTLIESMVPQYRLAPTTTLSSTIYEKREKGGFFSSLNPLDFIVMPLGIYDSIKYLTTPDPKTPANSVTTTVNTAGRGVANFVWLDMSYGGRAAAQVPERLQQVRRPTLIRFSGVKVAGTQVNGLSQWEALNQYGELPQEQGAVTRLTVADQTLTDGSVLLAHQQRGTVSLSLGQGRIQTADGQQLLTVTNQVIGGANALRGGYGCTDPATVVPYAGKVFYFCRERTELLRYDRNGTVPLGLTYKARTRLAEVCRLYAGVPASGCFNPHIARKDYYLTFPATDTLPGVTLVFSDLYEAWSDAITCLPEAGLAVGSELLSWQDGITWRHTPEAPAATFFGQYTAPRLTFTVAAPGGVAKLFKDVAIESGSLWLPVATRTDTGLESLMRAGWFTQREGMYRAGFHRAANTPGFPTVYHALAAGHLLIGSRQTLTLEAPVGAAGLTAVSVSWLPRTGQQMGV